MSTQAEQRERFTSEQLPPFYANSGPRISISAAVRQHWRLATAPVVVLVVLALLAGLARTPSYTAQTRLAVGRIDASAPAALAGFTTTSQSLAETYSRSVRGDGIVRDVARRLGTRPALVRARLAAAPIPQTPVFRVWAEAPTRKAAIETSVAASEALVRDSEGESHSNPESARLLRSYRKAQLERQRGQALVDSRNREYALVASTENAEALARARSDVAAAALDARSLEESFLASRQTQGSVSLVKIIERATAASSDRSRVLQLLVFLAVLAGAATGGALAVLRANGLTRRRLTKT